MANEAVIIELLGSPKGQAIRYTVADGGAIPKGTLLELTSPRTVTVTAADNDPFAGIAAEEKTASDGITNIAAFTFGIFDLRGSAAIGVGEKVSISGANTVTKVAAADLLFSNVGIALETTGGAATIGVLVRGPY